VSDRAIDPIVGAPSTLDSTSPSSERLCKLEQHRQKAAPHTAKQWPNERYGLSIPWRRGGPRARFGASEFERWFTCARWIIEPVALTRQAQRFVTVDAEFPAIQGPPAAARETAAQPSAAARGAG
jgi:hypothetical protein